MVILLVVFVSAFASSGLAQTASEKSGARALAKQGIEAYEAGDYEKALDLLTRAEGIYHAPPHQLFMARAHVKQGQFVEAYELYNSVSRETLSEDAPSAFANAQKEARAELRTVEPRIAHLTVSVVNAPDDVEVRDNGKSVDSVFLGAQRPVNPGRHELVASSVSGSSEAIVVELEEGGSTEISLELTLAGQADVGETPNDARPGTERSRNMVPVYVTGGVGIAGLALGGVFLGSHFSQKSKADSEYEACLESQNCTDQEISNISDRDSKAATAGTVAWVGFGVGAAGLITATYFLLSGDKSKTESASRPHTRPYLGFGEVGLRGTF